MLAHVRVAPQRLSCAVCGQHLSLGGGQAPDDTVMLAYTFMTRRESFELLHAHGLPARRPPRDPRFSVIRRGGN